MEVLTMSEYQKRGMVLEAEKCFAMQFNIHGEPHMYIIYPMTKRNFSHE